MLPELLRSIVKNKMAISTKTRLKVYERDGYKCVNCKASENLSIDHITPKSQGGLDHINNLRTMCVKCNIERGDFTPTFWQRITKWVFTRKDAHKFKNELLGAMTSKDGLLKVSLEQSITDRIASVKPTVQSLLDKFKQSIDVEIVGNKNSITSLVTRTEERDEQLLKNIYVIADRIDAMERYLGVEYVEEEVKEYRKIIN